MSIEVFDPPVTPVVFIIAGPMGCGKSTVGAMLAQRLGCPFYEGDDYHPAANIEKMRAGTPLQDEDRWPWLEALAALVQRHLDSGQPGVLACSALKPAYRHLLRTGRRDEASSEDDSLAEHLFGPSDGNSSRSWRVSFTLLQPSRATLERRLQQRAAAGGHFTPCTALLDSQLADLEWGGAEFTMVRLVGSEGSPSFPWSAEYIVDTIQQQAARAPPAAPRLGWRGAPPPAAGPEP